MGNALSAEVQVFDNADNLIATNFSNPTTGEYTIPISPGNYEVKLAAFSLPGGFAPPAAQAVSVADGTLSVTGAIDVSGGDGGTRDPDHNAGGGGGGGSGGSILLHATSQPSVSGTWDVSGGAGGGGAANGGKGSSGVSEVGLK